MNRHRRGFFGLIAAVLLAPAMKAKAYFVSNPEDSQMSEVEKARVLWRKLYRLPPVGEEWDGLCGLRGFEWEGAERCKRERLAWENERETVTTDYNMHGSRFVMTPVSNGMTRVECQDRDGKILGSIALRDWHR